MGLVDAAHNNYNNNNNNNCGWPFSCSIWRSRETSFRCTHPHPGYGPDLSVNPKLSCKCAATDCDAARMRSQWVMIIKMQLLIVHTVFQYAFLFVLRFVTYVMFSFVFVLSFTVISRQQWRHSRRLVPLITWLLFSSFCWQRGCLLNGMKYLAILQFVM